MNGVNEEELELIKQRYCYDLDYEIDDPYKQIVRHGFCHLYSSEYTVEEEREIVLKITTTDILRVAREIFIPEKLNFILVGPYTSKLKNTFESLVKNF